MEILESVLLVCKKCSWFGLVGLLFDFSWFWFGFCFILCIFNVFYIQNSFNWPFSISSINCKLPLSYYSLVERLAFLSPDMCALKTGKWSDIWCILTKIFLAWTIDLQRKQLAEDFMSWYTKICFCHICPIFSDFKSVYLKFKGLFFQSLIPSVEKFYKVPHVF